MNPVSFGYLSTDDRLKGNGKDVDKFNYFGEHLGSPKQWLGIYNVSVIGYCQQQFKSDKFEAQLKVSSSKIKCRTLFKFNLFMFINATFKCIVSALKVENFLIVGDYIRLPIHVEIKQGCKFIS